MAALPPDADESVYDALHKVAKDCYREGYHTGAGCVRAEVFGRVLAEIRSRQMAAARDGCPEVAQALGETWQAIDSMEPF